MATKIDCTCCRTSRNGFSDVPCEASPRWHRHGPCALHPNAPLIPRPSGETIQTHSFSPLEEAAFDAEPQG